MAPGLQPTPSPAEPKPTCYRIQGIPATWTNEDLRKDLRSEFPGLKFDDDQLSLLFPSCYNSDFRTALLKLDCRPDIFEKRLLSSHITIPKSGLEIDRDFLDLTPLNAPVVANKIVAEFVSPGSQVCQILIDYQLLIICSKYSQYCRRTRTSRTCLWILDVKGSPAQHVAYGLPPHEL